MLAPSVKEGFVVLKHPGPGGCLHLSSRPNDDDSDVMQTGVFKKHVAQCVSEENAFSSSFPPI